MCNYEDESQFHILILQKLKRMAMSKPKKYETIRKTSNIIDVSGNPLTVYHIFSMLEIMNGLL